IETTACENGPSPAVLVGIAEVLGVLDALRRLGIDSSAAARAAGIDPEAIARGSSATVASIVTLFAEAERRSADPLVGLHAAEVGEPRSPVAHLLMCCSTLEDALVRVSRFGAVIIESLRIDLNKTSEH